MIFVRCIEKGNEDESTWMTSLGSGVNKGLGKKGNEDESTWMTSLGFRV
jgi:hypothetical protein